MTKGEQSSSSFESKQVFWAAVAALAAVAGVVWSIMDSSDAPMSAPLPTGTSVPTATTTSASLAPSGGAGPSKADYVAASDRICSGAAQEIAKVARMPDTVQKIAAQLEISQSMVYQWGLLAPPPADVREVGEILTDYEEILTVQGRTLDALRKGDAATASRTVETVDVLFENVRRKARGYGFRAC